MDQVFSALRRRYTTVGCESDTNTVYLAGVRAHRLSAQTSEWTWLSAFWRLKGLVDLFELCCSISIRQLLGQTHTHTLFIKVLSLYFKKRRKKSRTWTLFELYPHIRESQSSGLRLLVFRGMLNIFFCQICDVDRLWEVQSCLKAI